MTGGYSKLVLSCISTQSLSINITGSGFGSELGLQGVKPKGVDTNLYVYKVSLERKRR